MESGGIRPPVAAAAAAAVPVQLTAEEEALKRNTDCVYFLASPLTCKKVFIFFSCSVFFLSRFFITRVCLFLLGL